MQASRGQTLILLLATLSWIDCAAAAQEPGVGSEKIKVATVQSRSATITQRYVCRIEASRHIEIRAPEDGYLQEVSVKEGQAVKKNDSILTFVSVLHQARLESELAEVQIAQLELNITRSLFAKKSVSQHEVMLLDGKLAKAKARAELAKAELSFTAVRAPFDGIIDRLLRQQGSFVLKGETLTNLFDNRVAWVYFNMPERDYLKHMTEPGQSLQNLELELVLANGTKFSQKGKLGAILASFHNVTGDISIRADFPNPEGLLRHGQTGTLLLNRVLKDAIVIPQGATFEISGKRYVYVVDRSHGAHQRAVVIENELDDAFVIKKGVEVGDRIVVGGVRRVRDGNPVE